MVSIAGAVNYQACDDRLDVIQSPPRPLRAEGDGEAQRNTLPPGGAQKIPSVTDRLPTAKRHAPSHRVVRAKPRERAEQS